MQVLVRTLILCCFVILSETEPAACANEPRKPADGKPAERKSRRFLFRYRVTVTDLTPGKSADVWIPIATSNRHQTVKMHKVDLPVGPRKTYDKRFHNRIFFFRAAADGDGKIPISIEYDVTRKHVGPTNGEPVTKADQSLFLRANRLVPVRGKPFKVLLGNKLLGRTRKDVRAIYDRVDRHVRYHKPAGGKWGRGDAEWVCDSRYGNCSDFHSLFISLCRTNGVPARFRIGFPIPQKSAGTVGGYHCWAEFSDEKRWVAVDISEADKHPSRKQYYFGNLPPDRVLFSTGRDLTLEPRQQSGPVNFFVFPHVEVDGKAHTKMTKQFGFKSML